MIFCPVFPVPCSDAGNVFATETASLLDGDPSESLPKPVAPFAAVGFVVGGKDQH